MLQNDLIGKKELEKLTILKELTEMKESELLAVKQSWEAKVKQLLRQVWSLLLSSEFWILIEAGDWAASFFRSKFGLFEES